MNTTGNNQPEQQDLDRARRLMEGFDPGRSPADADDPLLYYLDAYKKQASLKISAFPSESAWESISAAIDSAGSSQNMHRFPARSVYWKVAAILLAASLLVLAYITLMPSQPELLAGSSSEQVTTELFDGSLVTLRPYSSVYVMEQSTGRQTYKVEGEAYFDVAENPERVFTAVSGDAKVTATGTQFTLSNWSNSVRVFLQAGSVRFSTLDNSQSVELAPGEYSEKIGDQITEPVSVGGQTYTGWLTNELRLDSRTVSDVAGEIEHHFNITLQIPESLLEERLSGTLELQNSDQVLSDLALSLNGRFVQVDENRYRFEVIPQE